MKPKKLNKQGKEDLKKELRQYIKKGAVVFTALGQSPSPSGMYRHIKMLVINKDRILNLSYSIAQLTEWTYKDKTSSIGVSGCGMDMGYHLVHNLGYYLYDDGYSIKHQWI